jgi:glycosyltransferase involved in cell wall biosynthesis
MAIVQPPTLHLAPTRQPLYVEASPLLTKHMTGIGRFAARLIEALLRYHPVRLINTVLGDHARSMRLSNALRPGQEIAVDPDTQPADHDVAVWARRLVLRRPHRHSSRQARRSPVLYTMLRPAERHFGYEMCLLHDFTPALMPGTHVPETREYFGQLFLRNAALCDKLVANSHSTRADAGWLSTIPRDRVIVSYPGPTLCLHEHAHEGAVTRRDEVILVVCTLEPRKNGGFLLNWFLQTEALPPGMELWWVGPQGWLFHPSTNRQRLTARGRRIKFLGVVPDSRLCELYRKATFTVYPSLYEGFGFPVLDSLRHGTPVVSGFNSSLQEFAGPGVFYFDACDAASLDAACRAVLTARQFQRHDLAERFSWDSMARQVLALCA